MKYILPFLILFFIACEKKEDKKIEVNLTQQPKNIIKKIDGLTFVNNKLKFEKREILLICAEENEKCLEEADILKDLKVKFTLTTDEFLIDYFNIETFPTILIVDKNITKYEGFTPYEILKVEGLWCLIFLKKH